MSADVTQALRMRELIYGQLLSRALCVAAVLRLPDLIDAGRTGVDELARATATDSATLTHLLETLTAFDVLSCRESGVYSLTPLGATLRSDAPGSALPTALLAHAEMGAAWSDLLGTVRSGEPAFERVHGLNLFDYMDANPAMRAVFDQSQAADLDLAVEHLVQTIPLHGVGLVADVGGGDGTLLARLLKQAPAACGILMDTAATVELARAKLELAGLGHRVEYVAGDFFESVPPGADLYVMRDILHDWDDERAVQLLGCVRRAMPANSTLVIVERILDTGEAPTGADRLTKLMDLYMTTVLRGRERALTDFDRLVAAADLVRKSVTQIPGRIAVIEVVKL